MPRAPLSNIGTFIEQGVKAYQNVEYNNMGAERGGSSFTGISANVARTDMNLGAMDYSKTNQPVFVCGYHAWGNRQYRVGA